jgi:hypothetical protein
MKYRDAASFRRAIENRITNEVHGDQHLTLWRRRCIAFDRVIARIVRVSADGFYLKGGLALAYRFGDNVRQTVDMDFAAGSIDRMREIIRSAVATLLDDFFELRIALEPTKAIIEDKGVVAYRWAIEVLLAGRRFERITIDVGVENSAYDGKLQRIRTQPILAFADILPAEILVIPLEWHIAEKLHAYVRSYGDAQSTRVKDLVDLALLSRMGIDIDPAMLRRAIEATFAARKTSIVPSELPPPPEHWRATYATLSNGLDIPHDLALAHREAAVMLHDALNFQLHLPHRLPRTSRTETAR